jgi:alanyl-tRNA synthetase
MEAVTGPVAVELLRERDRQLQAIESAPAKLPFSPAEGKSEATLALTTKVNADALADGAVDLNGARVLTATVDVANAKGLLDVVDRVRGKLPEAAIVLGTAVDGRVHLVASIAPALVQRGVKAGAVVKVAAEVVGGGGGGRDTMAQAGGRDPEKLQEALAAGRAAIEAALASG